MLWSAQTERTGCQFIVHISRGSDNVATHTVQADSDVQAFDLAIEWAASFCTLLPMTTLILRSGCCLAP